MVAINLAYTGGGEVLIDNSLTDCMAVDADEKLAALLAPIPASVCCTNCVKVLARRLMLRQQRVEKSVWISYYNDAVLYAESAMNVRHRLSRSGLGWKCNTSSCSSVNA